jgi:hypothetical protein
MPVMESLRRLDNRLLPERDRDKEAARAIRYLPWMLVTAYLLHFATLFFTDSRLLRGLVSGLLLAAAAAALSLRFARSGGRAD